MIPRRIHQIWFQGSDQVPAKYHRFQQSWLQHHPSWQYIVWDQNKIEAFLESTASIKSLYDRLPHMIQKIDLAKYVILQRYGGVYVDMDMEALKPLDTLIDSYPDITLFVSEVEIGCSDNRLCIPMTIVSKGKYWTGPYYNNAVFAVIPNHPIWDSVFKDIELHADPKGTHHDFYIQDSTGPMMITRVIRGGKYPNIHTCPPYYFEPCNKFNLANCDTSKSYAVHYYENSWMSPFLKSLVYIYFHPEFLVWALMTLLVLWILFRLFKRQ